MKAKYLWALSYLLSVVTFSFIYYLCWINKPDSFIINQELNTQPFAEIENFFWDENSNYKSGYSYSLNELMESYNKDHDKIKNIAVRLQQLSAEKARLGKESEFLSKKQTEEIYRNFTIYDENKLAPFRQIEKNKMDIVSRLESSLPKEITTEKDVEKIKELGAAKIALSQARVDTAIQAAKNSQSVLDNVLGFVSNKTIEEIDKINQLEREQYEELSKLEKTRGALREQAIEKIANDRKLVSEKVQWVDFWFYSVGISTTTTFGDLIPNNSIIKLIVSFQLLLCVFILGGFVNAVLKS